MIIIYFALYILNNNYMKKGLLLILLFTLFIACSDNDDTIPDANWTYQSVKDFDAGKFPQVVGDTAYYNGKVGNHNAVMMVNPTKEGQAYTYNKLTISFNNEVVILGPRTIVKDIKEIDGHNAVVLICKNSNGETTNILNEYVFSIVVFDQNNQPSSTSYTFQENRIAK